MGPVCAMCGSPRTEEDGVYSPMQILNGEEEVGWFSGKSEDFCGPCMKSIFVMANGG